MLFRTADINHYKLQINPLYITYRTHAIIGCSLLVAVFFRFQAKTHFFMLFLCDDIEAQKFFFE